MINVKHPNIVKLDFAFQTVNFKINNLIKFYINSFKQ